MNQQVLWNSAEVKDGKLTVSLSSPPAGDPLGWEQWADAFDSCRKESLSLDNIGIHINLIRGAIQVEPQGLEVAVTDIGAYLNDLVSRTNDRAARSAKLRAEREERRRIQETESTARDEELTRRFRGLSQGGPEPQQDGAGGQGV